jgi:hypothetical protein
MSVTTDLLNSIGQGLTLTRSGGPQVNAGEILHFSVNTPDLANLSVPVIGKGDFSLTWLTKNVRFNDALPAPLLPDPDSPGDFLSLADSLASYLAETNILGGTPITAVQMPVPGPSLKGAIPPTTAIGIGISTVAGNVTPPTTNVTPTPVGSSPAALPDMPPLAPNTPDANDVLSGVPGLLGQIGGSIPVLMNAPVTLSVMWKVQRRQRIRSPRPPPKYRFIDLVPGTDFLAPGGLVGLAIDLIFAPSFTEYGQEISTPIFVSAIVTLDAGAESITISPTTTPPLPRLSVTRLDVGIPRVAAMFRHAGFAARDGDDSGFVFVMVPGAYAFAAFDQLAPVLQQLQTTLGTLNNFVHIVSFLTGLGSLLDAVAALPQSATAIQFRATDKVDDLENIEFDPGFSPLDADDSISSIIFLGISGSVFDLFGDSGCQAGHHEIVLTTGSEMWAALRSFSFHNLTEAQQIVRPASATAYVTGPAKDTWNDTTSSVCFDVNAGGQ